ncbi:MAG TPA: tetratricopeptide repeat protein [Bryobacteraceae bacterium]|nr:tetratricopeptide repeat protein [Bryobacteraceae bacterium]
MRILQARFVGPVLALAAAMFLGVSPGIAQRAGSTGSSGGATAPSPGKGTPTPAPSPGNIPNSQSQTPNNAPQAPRPIWISGKVLMYDGGPPPESVTIELLCSTNSVKPQGYTDSTGGFSFNLGQNSGVFADASTDIFNDPGQPGGFGQNGPGQGGFGQGIANGMPTGGNGASRDSAYWDCEIRARLPGYRSDSVSLAGRRMMDSPDIGVILLYPIAKIQGFTASATSGQAPKDARKAYEKGLNAMKKSKADEAELQFRKAAQTYPKYAEAWYQLGKTLESREHYPEARTAYMSALAADSKYVYPYQQLYQLALREQNWKDLVDKTDQLLHLDPYEFPAAYYFNALGHLELREFDAAEKSAQQAVDADRKQTNPKTHYLLGAIQIEKQNWTGAAENLRAYLKAAPNATDKAQVEKTLSQLDQQISRVQTASQDSAAQQ